MTETMPDARNSLFETRRTLGKCRLSCAVMLMAGMLAAATASATDNRPLITRINEYRESPGACNGQQAEPLGPLAPDDRLAREQVTSQAQLQRALQRAGYRPVAVLVLAVSGPANANAAMNAIKQHYCRELLDPQYAEIGVLRSANTWQVTLARPLLSSDLGDWEEAGKAVLKRVNQARAEPRTCGSKAFDAAPPVTWNAQLARAALTHSRDMAERNYFSHRGRDGNYADVRAKHEGYNWRQIGENIAAGQGSAKQAVSGWLASPGHCANIMHPHFTEMGAAYVVNPKSEVAIYWTQVFGRPR